MMASSGFSTGFVWESRKRFGSSWKRSGSTASSSMEKRSKKKCKGQRHRIEGMAQDPVVQSRIREEGCRSLARRSALPDPTEDLLRHLVDFGRCRQHLLGNGYAKRTS
mmetsp:Transcript_8722/g.20659  ORF Transcript_8722/g.20659 Transcript_8722/m.20659 type:complete len:108 (+) Transcript_8722:139-462(+)